MLWTSAMAFGPLASWIDSRLPAAFYLSELKLLFPQERRSDYKAFVASGFIGKGIFPTPHEWHVQYQSIFDNFLASGRILGSRRDAMPERLGISYRTCWRSKSSLIEFTESTGLNEVLNGYSKIGFKWTLINYPVYGQGIDQALRLSERQFARLTLTPAIKQLLG